MIKVRLRGSLVGAGAVLALLAGSSLPTHAASPVLLAQQDLPPGAMPGDGQDDGGGDASAMLLRMGRLEGQVRSLTGQIEQLQFQNKRLEDNLRKMQQDVDFRFQDLQRGTALPARTTPAPRRGDADVPLDPNPTVAADAVVTPSAPTVATGRTARGTSDAFDPDAVPTAPGAPRPLGTTPPSQPLSTRTASNRNNAPLDLMQRSAAAPADQGSGSILADDQPAVVTAPPAARPLPGPNTVASLVPGGTKEEFDADVGLYKQGQYDGAASGFQAFVEKYPKDRLVPDAVYLMGESFSKLGRHREAAEQFLKLSTDYGKSARAPDALLRLGMSLNALGAKEQACATYQEVNRRYPTASADVRTGVDRELKRARCQG